MTISERAVMRAIDAGADTITAIRRDTGAAAWWITLCLDALMRDGLLRRATGGRYIRA